MCGFSPFPHRAGDGVGVRGSGTHKSHEWLAMASALSATALPPFSERKDKRASQLAAEDHRLAADADSDESGVDEDVAVVGNTAKSPKAQKGKTKALSPKRVRIDTTSKPAPAVPAGKAQYDSYCIPCMSELGEHTPGEWVTKYWRAVTNTTWGNYRFEKQQGKKAKPCLLHWMAPKTGIPCSWGERCAFNHEVDSNFDDAERDLVVGTVLQQNA